MTETVIITHKSGSEFHDKTARYAAAQSVNCGYRTIVLSDDPAISVKGAEYRSMYDYSAGAARFASIYKHTSPNNEDYELFCFQRWFMIEELMVEIGGAVWAIDSDVLVYPGLHYLKHFAAGEMWNLPHTNYFKDVEHLRKFNSFCTSIYQDDADLERVSLAYSPTPHVSDMVMFYEYSNRFPRVAQNINFLSHYIGLDNGVRSTNGFQRANNHKIVSMRDGIPYCSRDAGGDVRFFTLHFQGISKPLMQAMHTIEDTSELDDLTYYFAAHPGYTDLENVKAVFDAFTLRHASASEALAP